MQKLIFKLKIFKLVLILLTVSNVAFATESEQIISQANKLYSEGKYQEAISTYQEIIKADLSDAKLYFNLGNSYFKLNKMPEAIVNFERAKRLDPADEDIEFNLNVANSRIVDKMEVIPDFFLLKWIKNMISFFSMDVWAYLSVCLLVLSFCFVSLYLLSKTVLLKKLGFFIGLIFFALSIISILAANKQQNDLNSKEYAIIFTPTITIKSSPDEKSTDIFVIHEGTKVRITDKVNDWVEIKISNGSKGWMKLSALEII